MDRRYSIVFDKSLARQIDTLAHEYDLRQEEVVRQLITVGLEELD